MASITVLSQGNVPVGPFTREQVAEKLQSGEFTLEQLAFVDGLSQWTPLRDVLAKVDGMGVAATVPVVPPASAAGYSYAATMQPPSHLVYAGFWLRFAAYLLDTLILQIPLVIVSMVFGFIFGFIWALSHRGETLGFTSADGSANIPFILFETAIIIFSLVAQWLYFAMQESSAAQATLGKRIIGIKVTNEQGQRIGFGQASGRFFGKIISGLTLLIGYIMAGFTEKKQALHDMLAGTLVVRN
jgi:uncharacterized RDD family membrane protein YckC